MCCCGGCVRLIRKALGLADAADLTLTETGDNETIGKVANVQATIGKVEKLPSTAAQDVWTGIVDDDGEQRLKRTSSAGTELTQNSDVPAPGNIEHLLHNTAEELLTGDFPEVSHSTLEATLGSYLGGCVTSPTGENHYIIPGLQHTYRWDATRAGAMIKDIIILFKMGIREHSLGYIQLYKCSKSMTSENLVLDGQQRTLTLYMVLSLLRCIAKHKKYDNCLQTLDRMQAFRFDEAGTGRTIDRFRLRQNQHRYFSAWFFEDPFILWEDFFDTQQQGNLRESFAEIQGRKDMVLLRLLHAADAIRKQLLTAQVCVDGSERLMYQDPMQLRRFVIYLRDSIKLGVGVLSGGGPHYCSWVFHQANFSQLTDLDMIKTDLICGTNLGQNQVEELADIWEQTQLALNGHTIPCLRERDAFRHCFYIARDLIIRNYNGSEPSSRIAAGGGVNLNIGEDALLFVEGYLKPTFRAMSLIFGLNTSTGIGKLVVAQELRCLLDRVQTHITALLEMTTFYSRDNYRPSMAVWMTIAVPLLANLYEPTDAKKLEVLAQMLHRLEILSLWVALAGVHWGRVVTILYTGGTIRLTRDGQCKQVQGVLKLLLPDGTSGVKIDTSMNEGKIMLARKMHQAEQNLSLTKEQLQEARDALLHVKTRPGKFRLARQLGDLIDGMQNDSLRAPNQDILVPAETQDLELLLTNSSGAQAVDEASTHRRVQYMPYMLNTEQEQQMAAALIATADPLPIQGHVPGTHGPMWQNQGDNAAALEYARSMIQNVRTEHEQ